MEDSNKDDDDEIADEAELNLDRVEEDMAADYSDEDDEDEILHIKDLGAGFLGPSGVNLAESQRPEEIMESNTDADEWKLEVERVAPMLKVQ